jgi:hypothetical protein
VCLVDRTERADRAPSQATQSRNLSHLDDDRLEIRGTTDRIREGKGDRPHGEEEIDQIGEGRRVVYWKRDGRSPCSS